MRVLFRKPVAPHRAGDVAEVTEGYAKNYLIPKQLAVPATAHVVQQAAAVAHAQQADAAHADQRFHTLLERLANATVHVDAKAAPSGTLYASIAPQQIAEAIAKQFGTPFPPKLLTELPTLKRAGQHSVTLHNRTTTITFTVDV